VGSRNQSDNPGTWTEPRQAPDLRSMEQVGRSPLPDEPFTIAALAADVATVICEVLTGPAVVLGHSSGTGHRGSLRGGEQASQVL